MATGSVSPRTGKVVDIPANAPTIGTATDSGTGGTATVAFTAPSATPGGPIYKYQALSNPGSITASGTTSPITITGLTNDTAYTFTVAAGNATGYGPYSSASNSATITGTSFESIATATGTGASGTITFSSIPSTYKHLQIRYTTINSAANRTIFVRLNGDTGTNFADHILAGTGTAASAGGGTSNTSMQVNGVYIGQGTTYPSCGVVDILDYASTTKNKVLRGVGGFDSNGSGEVDLTSGLWLSTSAINSVTIFISTANFNSGSTFALYGIKG